MKINYTSKPHGMFKDVSKGRETKPEDERLKLYAENVKNRFLRDSIKKLTPKMKSDICDDIDNVMQYSDENSGKAAGKYVSSPDEITKPLFLLLSQYIYSEYFNIHLRNVNDYISVDGYVCNIDLNYTGSFSVVHGRGCVNSHVFDYNRIPEIKIPSERETTWPNPEAYDLKRDLTVLLKYLEKKYPGIYFRITLNLQYENYRDGYDFTKDDIALVTVETDLDDFLETLLKLYRGEN